MDLVNLNNFFIKGYVQGQFWKDVSHFKDYDIKNAEDPNVGDACSVPKKAEKELKQLQIEIGKKLISKIHPVFKKIIKDTMVNIKFFILLINTFYPIFNFLNC